MSACPEALTEPSVCLQCSLIVADVLGSFEQAVLLAIVRLGRGAYVRAILNEFLLRLNRAAADGSVHATLTRLEHKGLASSRLGSGTAIRDGRARRFYVFTAAGARALNDARTAMDNA